MEKEKIKEEKIKAYLVTDINGERSSKIVYATTPGKAKNYCFTYCDDFEDLEWCKLSAKRFPEYDQFYNGKIDEDFWTIPEHRIRLVKEYGWHCFDIDWYCDECPAKEYCEYYQSELKRVRRLRKKEEK